MGADYSEPIVMAPTPTSARNAIARIPPIQCLLTFETLARLRCVTQATEELCVTPSAVSHWVKQLEHIIGTKLFGRADFSLTTEGSEYMAQVLWPMCAKAWRFGKKFPARPMRPASASCAWRLRHRFRAPF